MSNIHSVNDNTLIIQQTNETWFINKTEDGIKLKCEFLTTDGYEAGIDVVFNNEDSDSVIRFLTGNK